MGSTKASSSLISNTEQIYPNYGVSDSNSRIPLQNVSALLPEVHNSSNDMPAHMLTQLTDEKQLQEHTDSESSNTKKTGTSDIKAMMVAFPEALNTTPFKTSFQSNCGKDFQQKDPVSNI